VRGSVVYDPQFTMAVAYLWGLTPLPSNQIYQAWLVHPDGARTSAGLLEPDAESNFAVLVIEAPTPLSDFAGFGMTIEPAGGSPGPTGPKVAGADL
jgi:anti-sigma-K factor RskA